MKYIKKFESQEEEEESLTKKVDKDVFTSKLQKFEPEDFTEGEIKKIKLAKESPFGSKKFNSLSIPTKNIIEIRLNDTYRTSLFNYDMQLRINKREDGWILVSKCPSMTKRNSMYKQPAWINEYYILDGFEELLNLLRGDIIIHNSSL